MNVNKITVERLYANYDTLCRYEEEKTIKEVSPWEGCNPQIINNTNVFSSILGCMNK